MKYVKEKNSTIQENIIMVQTEHTVNKSYTKSICRHTSTNVTNIRYTPNLLLHHYHTTQDKCLLNTCSFNVCTRAKTFPQKWHLVWPLCVLQWCFRDPRLRNDLPQVSQQNSAAGRDTRSSDHRSFCNIHNGSKEKTNSEWIIMANMLY
jgi:hypothetical protein